MVDIWKNEYDWYYENSSSTYPLGRWYQIERNSSIKSGDTLNTHFLMFNESKCFSGITYRYINNLENIEYNDIYNSDDDSLYHMYYEYPLIDKFMSNITYIDIAINYNINTSITYYKLDNFTLKPNNRILLYNQNNLNENDIYLVTNNYKLILSKDLNNSSNSFRYQTYCKYGSLADVQFFLSGNTNSYPINNQSKIFYTGNTFLVKNVINYNLNTSSYGKIIFTDYELVKKQLNFNNIVNSYGSNYLSNINDDSVYYVLKYKNFINNFYASSITPSSIYNPYLISIDINSSKTYNIRNISGKTYVNVLDQINYYHVNDLVLIEVSSGNTNPLNILSYVIDIDLSSTSIIISDKIPDYIHNFYGSSGCGYRINNISYQSLSSLTYNLNKSPFNKYFNFVSDSNSINVIPNNTYNDKYIDYGIFEFYNKSDKLSTVSSSCIYINYNILNHLNYINSIFTNSYNFNNSYSLSYIEYNVNLSNEGIILYLNDTSKLINFYKYSYIRLVGSNTANTFLILDITSTYLLLEYPKVSTYTSLLSTTDIMNVSNLSEISILLNDIYLNYENINSPNYQVRSDDIRKKICDIYGYILSKDINIKNYSTGIIYRDNNSDYVLKLFNIRDNFGNINDPNLTYYPVELVQVGVNRKAKLPIPLKNENIIYNEN
jgi:hypothetical protein